MCVCVRSVLSNSGTLWTVACQAPLSTGILQARILERVAVVSSGDLPDPGTELVPVASLALADGFFTTSTTWETLKY